MKSSTTPRKRSKRAPPPDPTLGQAQGLQQTMSHIAVLERAIARILLLRFQQDIARLYSARLYNVSQIYIPALIRKVLSVAGPGWFLLNGDGEDIRDLFRGAIAMDLRQAGERTATKSILWSYTALRHFALSHDVRICGKRGLHSLHLLPFYPQLKVHLDSLEAMPHPTFQKPPQLGPLTYGLETVEAHAKMACSSDKDWRAKSRTVYFKLIDTLWSVAREFDVRGYGLVLREKLTGKWCDCGCSTDHLGEVCERTVREEESNCSAHRRKTRAGKEREWDGRGIGVYGWNTLDEEDLWEIELDFGGWDGSPVFPGDHTECKGTEDAMTVSELMEWRYVRAERSKELGNSAYRKGDYEVATKYYDCALAIEPELPHYQLNLAAAYLKLNRWMEAEKACTGALIQHRSSKGYFRRARSRRMMGKLDEAARDLRAALKIQPNNLEIQAELDAVSLSRLEAKTRPEVDYPPDPGQPCPASGSSPSSSRTMRKPPLTTSPFELTDRDKRRLKFTLRPLTVEIPSQPSEKESFAYPSWDRYDVKPV